MENNPENWPPLTAFYHYSGPAQSDAPSNAVAATTTANAPSPLTVTSIYSDGTTAATNHAAAVTIVILHNPIDPRFDKVDNDKHAEGNKNHDDNDNDSDPLAPSWRCVSCRKDFASTVDAADITTFPVFVGHCDCTHHAGCLAQPYFDRGAVLPVHRWNMACPSCGAEGFGREMEMGCWEDDDDDDDEKEDDDEDDEDVEEEEDDGAGDGDSGIGNGGCGGDRIVQFEMPGSAVVKEGMVVVCFEPEWEGPAVKTMEGTVSRRAVTFAIMLKWVNEDGQGKKEGEEGKEVQQDGHMPGDPDLPAFQQQLASLTLERSQKQ